VETSVTLSLWAEVMRPGLTESDYLYPSGELQEWCSLRCGVGCVRGIQSGCVAQADLSADVH
jgi:hypothetical protein